jgi:fucose permease
MSINSSKSAIVLPATVIFVYGTVASLLGTLLPSLSGRFHLSPEQNGYVAALQALGLALATLVAGPLMDSKGIKVTLCGGLSLMLLALLGLVSASGPRSLMTTICVLGLGSGTVVAASNNLASQVDEKKRASMVNLANTFFGLGGLATPFIAANILSGDPMRLAYLVAALTAGALLLALQSGMPASFEGFHLSELLRIGRKNLLVLLSMVVFVYVGCEVAFWNWLPKYLTNRGIEARTALNILGFGFACGIIAGRLLVLPLLHRVSASTVCIAGAVAMVGTTYATVHFGSPISVLIAVFLSGVAMGPVFPSTLGITSDAFPCMTGTCIAIVITAGWCGAAVVSWIVGSIAGSDATHLSRALMIVPLLSGMIVLLTFAVSRLVAQARAAVVETIAL